MDNPKPAFFLIQSAISHLDRRKHPEIKQEYTTIRFHPGMLPESRLFAKIRKKPMQDIHNRTRETRGDRFRMISSAGRSVNPAFFTMSKLTGVFLRNRNRKNKAAAQARNPMMVSVGRVDWQNNCQEHQAAYLCTNLNPGEVSSQRF